MKKKFKRDDIRTCIWGEAGYKDIGLEHVDVGQWIDEGKYQSQENILKEVATGKFYCYNLTKSGSAFTDFTFSFEWGPDEIELVEVRKATKTVEYWRVVE